MPDVGAAFALNAGDGSELWRFATDTRIKFGAAEISAGTVFLGDNSGAVHAVDASSGTERWTFQADSTAPIGGLPSMADGVLYVGGDQSTLYAIDVATGERRWQLEVGEPLGGAVIVTGGYIYFGTGLGSIMSVGVGDGSAPVIHAPVSTTATVPATPVEAAPYQATPAAAATVAASPIAGEPVEVLWETTGGDGGFAVPSTLTFAPDGKIWVADAGNARFQIFDADGTFVESWTGTGEGQFSLVKSNGVPFGAVAFAPDGSFYVLDPDVRRVLVFAADRTFLRSIGEPGRGPGQFGNPTSIAVDPAGNVAVLDPSRRDIQTFSPDGTLVATAPLRSTHSGANSMTLMIIDGDGNFLVAEASVNLSLPRLVEKFDAEGNLLQQFGDGSGPGSFGRTIGVPYDDQPVGIGIDAAGNVYVTEIGTNPRLVIFSPDGDYLMEIGGAGSATVTFDLPVDVLLDDQGNVYVTDAVQNRLVKLRLPVSLATPTP
jgi:outer membrane protein assembly factor BamB